MYFNHNCGDLYILLNVPVNLVTAELRRDKVFLCLVSIEYKGYSHLGGKQIEFNNFRIFNIF